MKPPNKGAPGAKGVRQVGPRPPPAHPFKPAVAQSKSATSAGAAGRPAAPPAYRPQAKPAAAQLKSAAPAQAKTPPAAPPAYRPQPAPKVLQAKEAHGGQGGRGDHLGRGARHAAPRPAGVIQRKLTSEEKAKFTLRRVRGEFPAGLVDAKTYGTLGSAELKAEAEAKNLTILDKFMSDEGVAEQDYSSIQELAEIYYSPVPRVDPYKPKPQADAKDDKEVLSGVQVDKGVEKWASKSGLDQQVDKICKAAKTQWSAGWRYVNGVYDYHLTGNYRLVANLAMNILYVEAVYDHPSNGKGKTHVAGQKVQKYG